MSKITQKDFRGFKAQYHRNSTDGVGFFVCSFLFHGSRRGPGVRLTGIVYPTDPRQPSLRALTAVFAAEDHNSQWNGPDFFEALSEAIEAGWHVSPAEMPRTALEGEHIQ